MNGLRDLQARFSGAVFDPAYGDLPAGVKGGGFAPGLRLQVYRNNVFAGFTEALRAVYPVTERLVGEEYFDHAGREFIRQTPSRSGDLHDFGREFGPFLATLPAARGLTYLPDVARLEWLYHETYHEADGEPLDLEALGRVPPAEQDRLRFGLNPACRLMRSEFPVIEIWRVNQQGHSGDQAVDLGSGGTAVLIQRHGEEVELRPLDAADYGMLSAIAAGDELATCLSAVLGTHPDFDLVGFLHRFVRSRTLTDFTAP